MQGMLLRLSHRLVIVSILVILHLRLTDPSLIEDSNHDIKDIKLPGEIVPTTTSLLKTDDKNSNPQNIYNYNLHCVKIIRRNPEKYKRFLKKRFISKANTKNELNEDKELDTDYKVRKRRQELLTPSKLVQSINTAESLYPAVIAKPSAVASMHTNSGQFVATGEFKPQETQSNPLLNFKLGQVFNDNLLNQLNTHTEQNFHLDNLPVNNNKDISLQPYGIYLPQDQNHNPLERSSNNIIQSQLRQSPTDLTPSQVGVSSQAKLTASNPNLSEGNKTSSTVNVNVTSSTAKPSSVSVTPTVGTSNTSSTTISSSVTPSAVVNVTTTTNITTPSVNATSPSSNVTSNVVINNTSNSSAISSTTASSKSGFVECPIDINNATAVLTKVLQGTKDVQSLIDQVDKSQSQQTADGMPCKLTGSWISDIAGVRFDLIVNGTGAIKVKLNEKVPPKPGILNTNWTMTGEAPMKRGMPFFLNGVDLETKQIASFCGLCKACGEDMIIGAWTVVRPARDCRDTRMIIQQRTDIFRKEILHSLQKGNAASLIINPTKVDSTAVNKSAKKRNIPTMWWTMT